MTGRNPVDETNYLRLPSGGGLQVVALMRECAAHPDPKTRMMGLSLLSDSASLPLLAPLLFNLRSCALILLLFGSSRKVRRVINKRS